MYSVLCAVFTLRRHFEVLVLVSLKLQYKYKPTLCKLYDQSLYVWEAISRKPADSSLICLYYSYRQSRYLNICGLLAVQGGAVPGTHSSDLSSHSKVRIRA